VQEQPVRPLGFISLLAALAFTAMPLPAAEGPSLVHFQLSRSAPEADASGPAPSEVRLWFSQEPQDGTTSIRLLDPSGEPVHTGGVVEDPEDGKIHSIALHGSLAPGAYTVAWRAIGQDGHVVRGDFAFSVTAD
jgi:methionine-rich copper-binding protein CopC